MNRKNSTRSRRTTEHRTLENSNVIDFQQFSVMPRETSYTMRSNGQTISHGPSRRVSADSYARREYGRSESYASTRYEDTYSSRQSRSSEARRGRRPELTEGGAWVDGNTVRKAAPKKKHKHVQKRKETFREVVRHQSSEQWKVQPGFVYMVILAICAAITLFVCARYLQLQADNTKAVKNIAKMEAQLTELTKENNDNYNRLMSSVDLNEIRDIAVNELGMVYAGTDQVILYDGTTNDYVRQYAEVPQDNTSVLQTLLASR